MDIVSQYHSLKQAYSTENLTNITKKILELYKKNQYQHLYKLLRKIDKSSNIEEEKSSKLLAKLMMLYHPDRQSYYQNKIEKFYQDKLVGKLQELSHIFSAMELENCVIEEVIDPEIDFSPEYHWEDSQRGNSYNSFSDLDEEDDYNLDFTSDSADHSFFQVMKREAYGGMNIELPYFLLEDMEEIELPDRGMDSLDGIEYCKQLKRLDLTNNHLTDISELTSLTSLQEVYLADNQIGYIDAISNLSNLRILDLSNNEINDITPLLDLEHLEYVNLIGNNIPKEQLSILNNKKAIVVAWII